MELFITIFLQVTGGLGMFLYGMDLMSKSFQEIAGNRLREIIHKMTSNIFRGIIVGTFITAIIQSSSVTTVMVVGFINASLMTLRQAIGIILGANIGTTITGWILVFKITEYGLPMIGIGAFVFLFSKNPKRKKRASIFIGLGLIFLGLTLMKKGMAPLKDMPQFIEFFHIFSAESYRGVILSALTGAALTSILQSSSATIGITMALATQGLIIPKTAVALVLGENIGTTITAYLASLKTRSDAKRAAYAHILIKIVGVSLILPFFYGYASIIERLTPPEKNISEYIALSHTLFNIGNAVIFLPFINILLRFLNKIGVDKKENESESYVTEKLYQFPLASLEKSRLEVSQMITRFRGDLYIFIRLIKSELSPENSELLFEGEKYQDEKKDSIFKNLTGLLHSTDSKNILKSIRLLLLLADTMESLGDYAASLGKIYKKTINNKLILPENFINQIDYYHEKIAMSLENLEKITMNPNIQEIINEKKICQDISTALQFVDPLKNVDYPEHIFMEVLSKYRRINRHILFMLNNLEEEIKLQMS
ncbi:Na/Pi cotransporter family protein [Ilyobacter polytropus]|uniref:Na/Pi-cotransporter II-related protein n=1 Tax=Ilyobacter polytropus (strain ATCC 51220 / DSM 2926 / LMG 16218 / CuHBu1) TaxID=572544 RepID=E3HD60_ILYPC|nr:Na/Pi cotransporter family protein [Ilyobacter polytropus]ADO84536.1 Na/Pi-cotransporter II-related protein [Ilyobacter polytropus DSM 2926]